MRWPWQHRHKKRNIAAVPQQLQAIQLQASAVGLAIPLVYGQARVPSKLIHYKKVLVGGAAGSYDFRHYLSGSEDPDSAAIAMAICEGPITGILQVWNEKDNASIATLTAVGFLTFLGSLSQAAWSFLTTNYPAEAVPYELTAYMAHPLWPTPGRAVANYSWEVQALFQWGGGIVDSNPKDIINDFLTDPNHGVAMSSSLIASLTNFRDYCTAAGIFLSPVFDTQRAAAEILQELVALANTAIVWSDGQLKFVPYGDQNLTANGATFTANVTPAYNLTDDDFIADEGDDPVHVTRRPQSDVYNMVQVEFDNRAYQYNGDIAEAKDQNSIELYQLKPAPVIKAPYIKLMTVARLVAQLAVQRQVYLRNTYEFTLPMRYALLEPMDLVTLTDPTLGFNQLVVRITEIDENDDDTFSVTAEDWIQGVSTAAGYGSDSTTGIPTAIGFEKAPAMPSIDASFDNTGQLLLNVQGDSRAVRHIYVVRTDRLPTVAETRAGTAVAAAGQSGIATGVTVAAGAPVYIGDLAYNSVGAESAIAVRQVKREGVDVDGSGRLKRLSPFDDAKFALQATETDGTTKSSSAIKPQGSVVPSVMANQIFSYAAGGPSSSAMWISFSWSAVTIRLPDGTTISVPASASLPTPATPSLSQVGAGSLGGRTLFARIGLVKNGMIYRVGAEASLAVSAFNVLKITSPSAVTGYDGWAVLVGSATNAEKLQIIGQAFGSDWTEPATGFDNTGTPFSNTSWPNAVTAAVLLANTQYFFYPWYDLAAAIVIFPDAGQTSRSDTAAQSQNSDGRIALTAFTAVDVTTPTAGNTGSGTKGGNKYL